MTRTSSRLLALIVLAESVRVSAPLKVVTVEPPVTPPWELYTKRETVSLNPFRSQAVPPRTVTTAVSAI